MTTNAQFPKLVMIIRHGEKPGNPDNDKEGGPNLSILGSARAAALPSLFTPDPTNSSASGPQLTCDLAVGSEGKFAGNYGDSKLKAGGSRLQTPNFLFATKPSNSSSRPVETITPTAQALQFLNNDPKLKIHHKFTNDSAGIAALKAEILNNPTTYGDQVILICWHHGMIPDLIQAFGVPACQLPWAKWPGTVFDLVFSITWPSNQPQLSVAPQQLLYTDSATAPDLGKC